VKIKVDIDDKALADFNARLKAVEKQLQEVTGQVKAGTKEYALLGAAIEKATAKLNRQNDALDKSKKKSKGWLQQLGGAAIRVNAVAGAARSAGAAVMGLIEGFASAAKTADMFTVLERSLGGMADRLAAVQKATSGTISKRDILSSMSLMSSFGIDMNKAGTIMEQVSKIAIVTGQDMNFMADSFARGVSRRSPLILDNLGLVVSVSDANKKYAESTGKLVTQLTKEEEIAALLSETLKMLEERTKGVNLDEMQSTRFASFNAALDNLKEDIYSTVGDIGEWGWNASLEAVKGRFSPNALAAEKEAYGQHIREMADIGGLVGLSLGVTTAATAKDIESMGEAGKRVAQDMKAAFDAVPSQVLGSARVKELDAIIHKLEVLNSEKINKMDNYGEIAEAAHRAERANVIKRETAKILGKLRVEWKATAEEEANFYRAYQRENPLLVARNEELIREKTLLRGKTAQQKLLAIAQDHATKMVENYTAAANDSKKTTYEVFRARQLMNAALIAESFAWHQATVNMENYASSMVRLFSKVGGALGDLAERVGKGMTAKRKKKGGRGGKRNDPYGQWLLMISGIATDGNQAANSIHEVSKAINDAFKKIEDGVKEAALTARANLNDFYAKNKIVDIRQVLGLSLEGRKEFERLASEALAAADKAGTRGEDYGLLTGWAINADNSAKATDRLSKAIRELGTSFTDVSPIIGDLVDKQEHAASAMKAAGHASEFLGLIEPAIKAEGNALGNLAKTGIPVMQEFTRSLQLSKRKEATVLGLMEAAAAVAAFARQDYAGGAMHSAAAVMYGAISAGVIKPPKPTQKDKKTKDNKPGGAGGEGNYNVHVYFSGLPLVTDDGISKAVVGAIAYAKRRGF